MNVINNQLIYLLFYLFLVTCVSIRHFIICTCSINMVTVLLVIFLSRQINKWLMLSSVTLDSYSLPINMINMVNKVKINTWTFPRLRQQQRRTIRGRGRPTSREYIGSRRTPNAASTWRSTTSVLNSRTSPSASKRQSPRPAASKCTRNNTWTPAKGRPQPWRAGRIR